MSATPHDHRRRARTALLPVLLLALGAALLAPAAPQGQERERKPAALSDKRDQIRQLGRERSQAEEQLARIQASEAELRLEVEKLADLVRTSRRRKEALEQRIRRQTAAVAGQEGELARMEREIREGERRIGQRLLRLYRMTKQGRSAVLFQMARNQTFAKDSHYLALLQDADRAAIARYEEQNRALAEAKRRAEQSVERLIALREELEEETAQLADREAYLREAMSDIAKNRTLYRRYLKDVERMMAGMEAAIARLEKESREAPPPPPRPRKPVELRGALPPPAEGEVIAAFGAQDPRYDLKKRQRGIVLRVPPETPVAAVAAGRAVHAGPFRGYQSLVVLDHGQGLFSVYGHLEELTIKRGDWVAQGKVLGRATYQPVDEAYDVYFEVRHNGQPDDPLAWLKPGSLRVAASAGQ